MATECTPIEPTVCTGDRLYEVAAILATAILRLHAKHVSGREKRRFCPDNLLELPAKTDPHAIRP